MLELLPTLEQYLSPHSTTKTFAALSTDPALKARAVILLSRVSEVLQVADRYGVRIEKNPARGDILTSGWRPAAYNAQVRGAAVRSLHIVGGACDIFDPEGEIDDFFYGTGGSGFGPDLLVAHNLWMEHPAATKGWAHFQDSPPRSGRRFFYP